MPDVKSKRWSSCIYRCLAAAKTFGGAALAIICVAVILAKLGLP